MRSLLIGSHALRSHGLLNREPGDIDLITDLPADLPAGFRSDRIWAPEFADWLPEDTWRTASIDELYTIKLSHAYWELHGTWNKHMYDLGVLQHAGAKVDQDLHDLLYGVWEKRHGAKKVDLTKESDTFFTDAVRRRYDHDSLHRSVAYGDRPLYEEVLKDEKSVQMDMKKVWAQPEEWIIRLFREEVYVTALERIIIPSDYTASPSYANLWALRRTITSLTKGRSAQFIAERYKTFRRADRDYVARHHIRAHLLVPLAQPAGEQKGK